MGAPRTHRRLPSFLSGFAPAGILGGGLVALALLGSPAHAAADGLSADGGAVHPAGLDAALSPDEQPERAARRGGKKSSSNSGKKRSSGNGNSGSKKPSNGSKPPPSSAGKGQQPQGGPSAPQRKPTPTELGRPQNGNGPERPGPSTQPGRPQGPDAQQGRPQAPGTQPGRTTLPRPDAASPDRTRPDATSPARTGPVRDGDQVRPTNRPTPTTTRPANRPAAGATPGRATGDRVGASRPGSGAPGAARPAAATRGQEAKVRRPDTSISRQGPARVGGGRPSPQVHHAPARHAVQARDHRYARPRVHHVVHHTVHHHVSHAPPRHHWYRAWHTHYWVHPWYRWTHATVAAVWFGWTVHAWVDTWVPPHRPGWVWVPGHWEYGWWYPGYWSPVRTVYVYRDTQYVYVPGWWVGDTYIEGYYRPEVRTGGSSDWVWVDGYYLEDGTYVWGHWVPAGNAPSGYVWVPGFWDGEIWVGGFWRPERRGGYVWVAPHYDETGVFQAGYWEPTVAEPGMVWIPGWFDGEQWVEGYWVDEAEYEAEDPAAWDAPDGWDAGWEDELDADDGTDRGQYFDEPAYEELEEVPLAIPVTSDEPEPLDGGGYEGGDYEGDGDGTGYEDSSGGHHAPPPGLGN